MKIPPNFSFARVGPDDAGCHAGDRTASILSCVAKKRSIGGMALGGRKEEEGNLRFFFSVFVTVVGSPPTWVG